MSENRDSCDCRKVEAQWDSCVNPGDFYFKDAHPETDPVGADRILNIRLPGGTFNRLPLHRGHAANPRVWGWDGNEDKPTVTPSIHCVGHWHGFLRAGRLESC